MTTPPKKPLPHWPWVVLVAGVIAAALAYMLTPTPAPRNHITGSSQIGGPFDLVDHTGKKFTEANLLGHYSVIYFGYTFCPDICPTELQTLSAALDLLPPEILAKVQPLFITVDPERDTVDVMARYVKAFHPKLTGLTGTKDEINIARKAYLIYAAKAQQQGSGGKNYLMDHVSLIYVMGTDGKNITHFSQRVPPGEIADTLRKIIGQGR
jgi:protein SCO1/2